MSSYSQVINTIYYRKWNTDPFRGKLKGNFNEPSSICTKLEILHTCPSVCPKHENECVTANYGWGES